MQNLGCGRSATAIHVLAGLEKIGTDSSLKLLISPLETFLYIC